MDKEHYDPFNHWGYYPPSNYYPGLNTISDQVFDQSRKIQKLQSEKDDLVKKLNLLEQNFYNLQKEFINSIENKEDEDDKRVQKKKKRKQLKKRHECPYMDCHCRYGSTLALNLHIKLKHNGGTKKEREAYAKLLIQYEKRGQELPKINCTFPPGFLQDFREKQKKRAQKEEKEICQKKEENESE